MVGDEKKELWILSTLTPRPEPNNLEILAKYDISFIPDPRGIDIKDGYVFICDEFATGLYKLKLWEDYFILDKENRTIFLRENYRNPGIKVEPVFY